MVETLREVQAPTKAAAPEWFSEPHGLAAEALGADERRPEWWVQLAARRREGRRQRRVIGLYLIPVRKQKRLRLGLRGRVYVSRVMVEALIVEHKRAWVAILSEVVVTSTWPKMKRPKLKIKTSRVPWRQPGFTLSPRHWTYSYTKFAQTQTVKVIAPGRARPLGWQPGLAFMPQLQEVYATEAETTTTADPGTGGTSLAVTSRSLFPQAGKFYIIVQDSKTSDTNREVMRVTAGQGSGAGSFTVTRGLEGTSGVAHVSGSYVAAVLVAKSINTSFRRCYVPDYTFYSDAASANTGAVDGTTAGQAAIDNCNADGGGKALLPGWAYISTTLALKANVTLAGEGRRCSGLVASDTNSSTLITATGSVGSNTTLTAPVAIYDRSMAVTSSAIWVAGDWLMVTNSSLERTWISRVLNIDGNTITMEERSPTDPPTASTAAYKWNPLIAPSVRDLTLQTPSANCLYLTTRLSGAINFTNCLEPQVINVEIRGFASDGGPHAILNYGQCRNAVVRDSKFENCADSNPSPNQFTQVVSGAASTHIQVIGNSMQRCGGSGCITFEQSCHLVVDHNQIGGTADWAGNGGALTTATGGPYTLPTATINVASTTGPPAFAASGKIYVINDAGTVQTVAYTGTTATSFTGCTGGTGTVSAGKGVGASVTVADNGGRGIKFWFGCSFFSATSNELHDNGFDGIHTGNARYGVLADNVIFAARDVPMNIGDDATSGLSSDIEITGNRIHYVNSVSGPNGIWCYASASGRNTRITISNNQVTGVGTSQPAILLANVTDSIVSNNITTDSGSSGIKLGTGSTRISIDANMVRNSTTWSIDTASSSGVNTLSGNIVDRAMTLHNYDTVDGGRSARLTSDVSKTTTAATDVTGLFVGIAPNETEQVRFVLFVVGGTGGVKFALTVPAGATMKASIKGESTAVTAVTSERMTASGTLTTAVFCTSVTGWVEIDALIANSSTGGTVQLQYGSGTTGQTANVQALSYVRGVPQY